MKKISTITSLTLGSLLALAPLAVFAQTSVVDGNVTVTATTPVTTSAGVSASANTSVSNKVSTAMGKGVDRGDTELTARISALNDLSTRIGEMKNVSASEKTSLQESISTQIASLTGLKATIDADTDPTKLKTDVQSITSDYRIYALVVPQGRIAAASDRITTIVSLMQQLGTKLSARITAAQTAGVTVSAAQSAYTDMQAKVADANTQSQAALSETVSLQPDQGNATVEASNTAALKDAAAKIKVSTSDLVAARADITTILNAVKGTGSASVTANTSAQ